MTSPAQNLGETNYNGQKYLKKDHFSEVKALVPVDLDHNKKKIIGLYAAIKNTLTISIKSSINHNLTCFKSRGKQQQQR